MQKIREIQNSKSTWLVWGIIAAALLTVTIPFWSPTPAVEAEEAVIQALLAQLNEDQQLSAADELVYTSQGFDVDISGNTAIIGAPFRHVAGINSGTAYIMVRSGSSWSLQSELIPADLGPNDEFGTRVTVDNNTAAVYASTPEEVFIFERSGTTWSEQAALNLSTFVDAINLAGNTLVIGQPSSASTGTAAVYFRSGSSWSIQGTLTANDGASGDNFGRDVAIDGDTIIVGAYTDDDGGNGSGSAYVFTRSGSSWTQQAKLTAGDAAADDLFGHGVALSGDTTIIGAPGDDGSGSAYVFVRSGTTWSQQAKLTAAALSPADQFGGYVGLDGNTAVISAVADDTRGDGAGAVYVFTRSGVTWSEQTKLTAGETAAFNFFGWQVALDNGTAVMGAVLGNGQIPISGSAYVFAGSGATWEEQGELVPLDWAAGDFYGHSTALYDKNTALIGAIEADGNAPDSGAVYVFRKVGGTWSYAQKLSGNDSQTGDRFGRFIVVDGDTALIGADRESSNGSEAGAVYVLFRGSNGRWTQQAKLLANDGQPGDRFGISGDLDGDTAVVGAYDDDGNGSAYIFTRSGSSWTQQSKLIGSSVGSGDRIGWSVALSGDTAVVGAIFDDDLGSNAGAAYIFNRSGSSWSLAQKLTRGDGSDWFGRALAIEDDVLLIGSPRAGAGSRGLVYEYVLNGRTWEYKDTLAGNGNDGSFGHALSFDGTTALIGTIGYDVPFLNTGRVAVYERGDGHWVAIHSLTSSDGAGNDHLGSAVALAGQTALVGADQNDDWGDNSGSAYLFTLPEPNRIAIIENTVLRSEGNDGNTSYTFTVTRTGQITGTLNVPYTVNGSGSNPADASDFGGSFPSGTAAFASGESAKQITIDVQGDGQVEADEQFTVSLTPVSGVVTQEAAAVGTIENDDAAGIQIDVDGGLGVSEDGQTDTLTISLTSEPTSTVEVILDPDGQLDVGSGPGQPVTQTFTAGGWNIAQTVTVLAVDDADQENNHQGVITFTVSSGDGSYDGINLPAETVAIVDNDGYDLFLPMIIR